MRAGSARPYVHTHRSCFRGMPRPAIHRDSHLDPLTPRLCGRCAQEDTPGAYLDGPYAHTHRSCSRGMPRPTSHRDSHLDPLTPRPCGRRAQEDTPGAYLDGPHVHMHRPCSRNMTRPAIHRGSRLDPSTTLALLASLRMTHLGRTLKTAALRMTDDSAHALSIASVSISSSINSTQLIIVPYNNQMPKLQVNRTLKPETRKSMQHEISCTRDLNSSPAASHRTDTHLTYAVSSPAKPSFVSSRKNPKIPS